jgi:nicotinate-nucleotide adenylyltransferase
VSRSGRRIGVFGGTFDPPHIGHLVAAVNVRHSLALDAVLLVVANVPWQKVEQRPVSSAKDRLAMVEAAVGGVDGLEASAVEVERGGASYTVETLEELRDREPGVVLFCILGADAAAGLATWERAEGLAKLATLVLVDRPGMRCPPPPPGFDLERVEVPRLEVSSTDLRERFVDGRPVDFLVPAEVVSCIRERHIYRGRP